ELKNRNTRRVELHDDRRLNSDRQERSDRIRGRYDLRDCKVEIYVRLKIDFLNRQSIKRLRLHILDAVDVGADRILAVSGDALFHFRRAKTSVLPNHGDHRDLNFREDISWHRADCRDADKDNERGKHVERIRVSQREADDAHFLTPKSRRRIDRSTVQIGGRVALDKPAQLSKGIRNIEFS